MFCSGATPRRALKSAAALERSREGRKRKEGRRRCGRAVRAWSAARRRLRRLLLLPLAAMSSVDLSSAWALERLAARRAFPSEARTGACRSLFGPVDHEQLRRELRGQLRQIREESQRRWEYDFRAGAPLPAGEQARFQWEEVGAAAVPAFYRETLLPGAGAPRRLRRKSQAPGEPEREEGAGPESHAGTEPPSPLGPRGHGGADAAAAAEEQESGCYSGILLKPLPGSAKRTRVAHITDFFAKRKRVAADSSSALPASVAAALPSEQTPRKRLR